MRIIRAVRFVNVVNQKLLNQSTKEKTRTFDYDGTTRMALKKNFFLLQFVAKERIKEEICKAFKE